MDWRERLVWLPNLISLIRLFAVPVIVLLMLEEAYAPAFWLFVAAGASDALDGFIARRWRLMTRLGAYLDPLADKVLLVAIYVTLGFQEQVATWLVILVLSRDVLIMGGALLYHHLTHDLKVQPLFVSKLNTVAQILLVALIMAKLGLSLETGYIVENALVALVALTSFVSGGAYLVIWGRKAMGQEDLW
ncbi:CDP-alcohol phosphatidyltransferase family protein [Fodinicurvata sediminis]|uniref:CDP-alcohol phosphatidyltransferase family protein n=1 Tax=Fodinicurvata sediminis TaxID=1121832 RepID=UPI0003B6311E|nr:CDP-alcohol phosphatidyltransferase family protein [Fodinicurvata sediminis]